jgi:hypothetical protein
MRFRVSWGGSWALKKKRQKKAPLRGAAMQACGTLRGDQAMFTAMNASKNIMMPPTTGSTMGIFHGVGRMLFRGLRGVVVGHGGAPGA